LDVMDAITGGTAVITGGTLEFNAASSVAVTFDNGAGGTTYGVLILVDPAQYTGDISGFTGTAPNAASSDEIDLIGINYNSGQFTDSYNAATGVLTVSDGTNTDSLTFVGFTGNASNFDFSENASGTGTLVTDPQNPQNNSPLDQSDSHGPSIPSDQFTNFVTDIQQSTTDGGQSPWVTVGGPNGDQFVFTPGLGAETAANFNPQQDFIELDHFANVQTTQELESLVTTDAHGYVQIDLGHHDSITFVNTTTQQVQQAIQAGHVLLH
jgi:hypothetical protein